MAIVTLATEPQIALFFASIVATSFQLHQAVPPSKAGVTQPVNSGLPWASRTRALLMRMRRPRGKTDESGMVTHPTMGLTVSRCFKHPQHSPSTSGTFAITLTESWRRNHQPREMQCVPLVPHKAVAEVSKIGNYRRDELLQCMDGTANPLMEWKVVGCAFWSGCSGHLTHNCWM